MQDTGEQGKARGSRLTVQTKAPPLDAEAFGRMHRDYRDHLVRSVAEFVRDREQAEDIAARAFRTAWDRRETFRGEARPETWLQAIARNEARRSLGNERPVSLEDLGHAGINELASSELVTDGLEKQDDRIRLRNALNLVPAKCRRALEARFVEGLSIRKIAQQERVPYGTVLSRIHKGKQLLREAWEIQRTPEASNLPAPGSPREPEHGRRPAPVAAPIRVGHPGPLTATTWDR